MSKNARTQSARPVWRSLLAASFGIAAASVAICSLAGALVAGSSIVSGTDRPLASANLYEMGNALLEPAPDVEAATPQISVPVQEEAAPIEQQTLVVPQPVEKVARLVGTPTTPTSDRVGPDRFDAVVKRAALTPAKLASLFAPSALAGSQPAPLKIDDPAPARFAVTDPATSAVTLLAFADPAPSSSELAGLLAPGEHDLARLRDQDLEFGDVSALLVPDFENTPPAAPAPALRPRAVEPRKPIAQAAAPKPEKPVKNTDKPSPRRILSARQADRSDDDSKDKPALLAFARPDDPAGRKSEGGSGDAFRGLFRGSRPGKGVAVYDISAARVYMPYGSVLEAHSGIGHMADDPRYVHVKMKGPTPPHTYNLKMRETRFHGVEAIRMLPVDGKNKHGRDGFLTHSYLLRGGRAESHGCVAFKDYDKFLRAFKQGKVKQLVVVPSGGRAVRLASNGKSI